MANLLHGLPRLIVLTSMLFARPAFAADQIHIRKTGSGPQCWVLLHPLGMSGKFWDRRAKLLSEEYHVRVYAPDLPDHGLSALVPRFDYDRSTDAVAAALRPLCPHPGLIIGASSGGIVAMKLAARWEAKAAVIGVGWSFTKDNVRSLEEQSRPNRAQDEYLRTYAEQGDAQIVALYRSFNDLAELGTRPLLSNRERKALSGRLLVINGFDDNFFRPESVQRLQRKVRNTQLHLFMEAGHLAPLAEPFAQQSWKLIDQFVTGPSVTAPSAKQRI